MKVSQLFEVSGKPTYVGDVIGSTPASKQLAAKQTPQEKLKTKKVVARAGAVVEQLGQLYSEFQTWVNNNALGAEDLKAFLTKLEAEAKIRGEDTDAMIDDLMGPLTVDQLKKVIKHGSAPMKKSAAEELRHRNQ